jgi:hypothetical protein
MDGSAFRGLDFGWLKWMFALAAVGALSLIGALGWAIVWFATHVTIS